MYCPYRTVFKQKTETEQTGENGVTATVISETIDFLDCYEDDCAMWQDGQCWKRG